VQKLAEIIERVVAAMQAMATHTVTVMKPVFKAGRWTLEATTAIIAAPFKAVSAVFSGSGSRSGGSGPAAAQQAQAATERAQQTMQATNDNLSALQTAKLISRAARYRVAGHEHEPLIAELPDHLATWMRSLSMSEADQVAKMPLQILVDLAERDAPLPGIRSPREIDMTPSDDLEPDQADVLDILRQRLMARQGNAPAAERAMRPA
jgi:hypothetical protein